MPQAEVQAPAPAPTAGGAQPAEEGMSSMMKSLLRAVAIFFGIQLLINSFSGKKAADSTTTTADALGNVVSVSPNTQPIPPFLSRPETLDEGALYNPIPQRIAPMWPLNSLLDMVIIISPTPKHEPLHAMPKERVILDEKGFMLGNFAENRAIDTSFSVPEEIRNNGTLWGHFYVGLSGSRLDPTVGDFDPAKAFHFAHPLTQYIAKKRSKKTKNLLTKGDESEGDEEEPASGPIVASHYHPNFTMSFIPDTGVMNYPSLHPAVRLYVHPEMTGARDSSGQNGWYYPVLYINTFWQLKSHMSVLNSTVTTLPMHITMNNLNNWKFSIMSSIDEGAKQTAKTHAHGGSSPGGGDGSEIEMVKEIILDTNIYLLSTTVVVSVLHMIFEMLAFKNDISHFRNKKNNVGISVRSILGNVFMQGVIFLYLLDNNENTSWMILFSQGLGIALELWKITTVVDIRIRPSGPNSTLPYKLVFEDKHSLSETEEKTKEYDEIAFNYLYMVAAPLLLAYAAYSLSYQTHKSWYSFVISTLVGSVYAYGFLMMVPSLYINYRLKSVAHMPAKAMMYKFLNTFIDDLFAFTIKMPLLHRLATLRDDVIFFVYLWQSWKYKIDYKRVNEFGQGGEEDVLHETRAETVKEGTPITAEESQDSEDTGKGMKTTTTGSTVMQGNVLKRR